MPSNPERLQVRGQKGDSDGGGLRTPLLAASFALNAADYLTRPPTAHEQFVRRFGAGNNIAREIYERPALLAASKLAVAVVFPELCARYLERRRQGTAATVLRVLAIVAPAYGTFTNVRGKIRRGDW